MMRLVNEPHERVLGSIRQQHDIAAFAAVTAIGPAFGNVLLAPQADAAIATLAAAYRDGCVIDEHSLKTESWKSERDAESYSSGKEQAAAAWLRLKVSG
jgi:hypothetical protein